MQAQCATRTKSPLAIQCAVDAKTLRRINLEDLEDDLGSLAAIERATNGEVTASYLSQVKNAYREMGDRVARKLEKWLEKPQGWMDSNHRTGQAKVVATRYRRTTPGNPIEVRQVVTELTGANVLPSVYSIPVLEIEASMGVGTLEPEHETVVGKIELNQQYVRTRFPTLSSPTNLRVVSGRGDSMWNAREGQGFQDGDPLFLDVGITDVRTEGVYLFGLNGELYVKALQRLPDGALKVISYNDLYPPYVVGEREQIRVIGRVLGGWNHRKF